jgi:hypothetical protein
MPSIPAGYGTALLSWEAPEHEPLELGPRSSIIVTGLLIAIVAYALDTNSPLMAITFILIGVVGYLSLHREPRILFFCVTTKGVIAGNEFYEFDTIESFHFYTEPPFENLLSLKTNGKLVPYVHIPIMTVEAGVLRDTLDEFIPEDRHEPGLVDTLERLLHI